MRSRQLFLEVFEKKPVNRWATDLLPHFGHVGAFLSCSAMPMITVNRFAHLLQEYSYVGIVTAPLSFLRAPAALGSARG